MVRRTARTYPIRLFVMIITRSILPATGCVNQIWKHTSKTVISYWGNGFNLVSQVRAGSSSINGTEALIHGGFTEITIFWCMCEFMEDSVAMTHVLVTWPKVA